MKKIFFLMLLVPFLLTACTNNEDDGLDGEKGRGCIVLDAGIDVQVNDILARSTSLDHTTYKVVIVGPEGPESKTVQMDYPDGGKIDGLAEGNYTITATSHPGELPAPAFDNQVYSGSAAANVKAKEETTVSINCKQANAGIFFEYDNEGLAAAGLANLVPTLTQDGHQLMYKDDKALATGYFSPGQVVLTLDNDGQEVKMGGQTSKTYTVAAHQLWKMKLEVALASTDGNLSISVTVKPITTNTDEENVIIDLPEPVPGRLTIAGADLSSATAEQKSATTELIITGDIPSMAWYSIRLFSAAERIILKDFNGTIPNYAFSDGMAGTLPESVVYFEATKAVKVGNFAFTGSTYMKHMVLPQVTEVGEQAFNQMLVLEELSLPKVNTMGYMAAANCKKVKVMSFPELVTAGEAMAERCTVLESFSAPLLVNVPNGMLNICRAVNTIELPLAQTVGNNAFNGNWAMKELSLPETVTFGSHVFANSGLMSLSAPKLETMGVNCFSSSDIVSVELPVVVVPNYTFSSCKKLVSVSLPNAISVGQQTFYACALLTELKFGATEKISLGANAFGSVTTSNVDLFLNSAGQEFATVSGTSWQSMTWKSVQGYEL